MASIWYQWFWMALLSLPGLRSEAPAASLFLQKEVPHPYFVSVTEINHNQSEKDLEITCKIFADDLEATLEKNYKTTVDLSAGSPKADSLINAYIGRNLLVAVDGVKARLGYIGFEQQRESVYCYFHVSHTASLKKLKVRNTLLHDYTIHQVNIVHAQFNGLRRSTRLEYPKAEAEF